MIYTLEGPMGSTKTTTAVMLAHYNWENSGPEFKTAKRKVISNVPLNFEHILWTMEYQKQHHYDEELMNCEIIWDEPYAGEMDAHMASSPGARMLAKFAFEARKRHVNLYFCTHKMSYLLNRLRDAINMNGVRGSCRSFREWPCGKCKGTGAYPAHGEIIDPEAYRRYDGADFCDRCLGYGKVEVSETWFTNSRRLTYPLLNYMVTEKRIPLRYTANYYWHFFPTENRVALAKRTFDRIETDEIGEFVPKGEKLLGDLMGKILLAKIDGDLMKRPKGFSNEAYDEITVVAFTPSMDRVKIRKNNLPKKPEYWLDNDGRIVVVEVLGTVEQFAADEAYGGVN